MTEHSEHSDIAWFLGLLSHKMSVWKRRTPHNLRMTPGRGNINDEIDHLERRGCVGGRVKRDG